MSRYCRRSIEPDSVRNDSHKMRNPQPFDPRARDSIAAMGIGEALARKSEQARAVFYHVGAQRQIANITIERSVEMFMIKEKIDMREFERVLDLYKKTSRTARENGYEEHPCTKCPQA